MKGLLMKNGKGAIFLPRMRTLDRCFGETMIWSFMIPFCAGVLGRGGQLGKLGSVQDEGLAAFVIPIFTCNRFHR